jgi:hypothetical protein
LKQKLSWSNFSCHGVQEGNCKKKNTELRRKKNLAGQILVAMEYRKAIVKKYRTET